MQELGDVWFTSSPEVCRGKLVFKGTRVPVEVVARMLRRGYTPKEVHEEYPSVPLEAIEALWRSITERKPVLVEVKG